MGEEEEKEIRKEPKKRITMRKSECSYYMNEEEINTKRSSNIMKN